MSERRPCTTIEISTGAKCAECGKGGAVTRVSDDSKDDPGCGLCMRCVSKAIHGRAKLKSVHALAVRLRSLTAKATK